MEQTTIKPNTLYWHKTTKTVIRIVCVTDSDHDKFPNDTLSRIVVFKDLLAQTSHSSWLHTFDEQFVYLAESAEALKNVVSPKDYWLLCQIDAIDKGILDFGIYNYFDKGFAFANASDLKALSPKEAGQWIKALHDLGKPYSREASNCLGWLGGMPEDWWNDCCDECPDVEC
jgi:hypothetical protein